MYIFGMESSCDETSASVVEANEGSLRILSNVTVSQIDIHRAYGGVVPEIAGRAHIEAVSSISYEALKNAGLELKDIDAVGVTYTPGLIGCLLVGVNFAKSLALSNGIPLVPVDHIKGHIAANYFSETPPEPPFMALVASGGHTSLVDVRGYTDHRTVGATRDDAAGEAFDKAARMMGIPYPGGAEVDRLASLGNARAIRFPSAAISDGTLDFSFSGLKTAVVNYIHNCEQKNENYSKEDVCASFTKTAVDSVIKRLREAAERYGRRRIVAAGGVAANSHLRAELEKLRAEGYGIFVPERSLCGDNGAMIAAQAYFEFKEGNTAGAELNAIPS